MYEYIKLLKLVFGIFIKDLLRTISGIIVLRS